MYILEYNLISESENCYFTAVPNDDSMGRVCIRFSSTKQTLFWHSSQACCGWIDHCKKKKKKMKNMQDLFPKWMAQHCQSKNYWNKRWRVVSHYRKVTSSFFEHEITINRRYMIEWDLWNLNIITIEIPNTIQENFLCCENIHLECFQIRFHNRHIILS